MWLSLPEVVTLVAFFGTPQRTESSPFFPACVEREGENAERWREKERERQRKQHFQFGSATSPPARLKMGLLFLGSGYPRGLFKFLVGITQKRHLIDLCFLKLALSRPNEGGRKPQGRFLAGLLSHLPNASLLIKTASDFH